MQKVRGYVSCVIKILFISLILPINVGDANETNYYAHGVAMHGSLKYDEGFAHFDYVNPKAPKGGLVRLSRIGTYDTLNPFILKGLPAAFLGLTFESLMVSSQDEAFSQYGLIASHIEIPSDRSSVTFTIREEAKWHDGTSITVADVIFSFETLLEFGHPFYRAYYRNVIRADDLGFRRVRFSFANGNNWELPLIMGQLVIIPKIYFKNNNFQKSTLEPILGSGPYKVHAFDAGRTISYKRISNYWGKNLPVNRGRYNFDIVRIDYYRDSTVALEAFKAHELDWRIENTAKLWARAYSGAALDAGLIKKVELSHQQPTGLSAFIFNIRRPVFSDRKVREALNHAFDFEWTNKNIFFGSYTRTRSYFSNSELASHGLPVSLELKVLEQYRGQILKSVFEDIFTIPQTDGAGNNRQNLSIANRLNQLTGDSFEFEFLLQSGGAFERVIQPFARNLERLGIKMSISIVDSAQYQNRTENFDFDMLWGSFAQSLSPGNEQRNFWSSRTADVPGSQNLIGIKDPVIDKLIDHVVEAPDRETLIATARALDRVLLWGYYVVPLWHLQSYRLAFWDIFGRPEMSAKYDHGFPSDWWVDIESQQVVLRGKDTLE